MKNEHLNQEREHITSDRNAIQEKVLAYAKRVKLKKVIAILCVVVMLFTINSLKFEGVTLEHTATCGLEEHVHGEGCYDEEGNLICGLEEHVHTDACFQERPKPEPTVLDQYLELDGQVVLVSPMDDSADGEVVSANVEEEVGEIEVDLGGDDGEGLTVEYEDEPAAVEEAKTPEYNLNGGDVAFLSDVLNAVEGNIKNIVSVGELQDSVVSAVSEHITVEPVEGIENEFILRVTKSFDQIELCVVGDEIITLALLNGVAVEEAAPAPVEESSVVEDEQIVEEINTNVIEENGNETTETELKQTEVGDEQTEVEDAAPTAVDENPAPASEGSEAVDEDAKAVDEELGEVDGELVSEGNEADGEDKPAAEDETADGDASVSEDGKDEEEPVSEDESAVTGDDDEQISGDEEQVGGDESPAAKTQAVLDFSDYAYADQHEVYLYDSELNAVLVKISEIASADGVEATLPEDKDAEDAEDATLIITGDGEYEMGDTIYTVTGLVLAGEAAPSEDAGDEEAAPAGEAVNEETAPTIDEETVAEQTGDEATDSEEVEDEKNQVILDFSNYVVADDHEVYLYDGEMKAVLVNVSEIASVDGVEVTMPESTSENDDEDGEADEGALIITADGEYEMGGKVYVATGLVLEEDAPSEEDSATADEENTSAPSDDEGADEQADEETVGEAPEEEVKSVVLDFADYIATDDHTAFLYDSAAVAVMVNVDEIASVDGVEVIASTEEETEESSEASTDEDEASTDEDEEAAQAATLVITDNGEYELNGVVYTVKNLILPVAKVENDTITISTSNEEATLLNVAPVFEETDEDYDDIFSLFAAAQDDPTLIAKLADALFGVAYAEEAEVRTLQMKLFNIGLQDADTGDEVEPGTTVHVETSFEGISGEDFKLYHIVDGRAVPVEDAVVVEDGQAVGFDFYIDSLSPFALVYYTVDFEYTDPVTGETKAWSLDGRGTYPIADILSDIGVTGAVEGVELERTEDVGGPADALYLNDDRTALVSDAAFNDTFELTVTVDGVEYKIIVTDDNGYTVNINIDSTVTLPEKLYIVFKQTQPYSGWSNVSVDGYYFTTITSATTSVTLGQLELLNTGGVKVNYDSQNDIEVFFACENNNGDITTNSFNNNSYTKFTNSVNGASITYNNSTGALPSVITISGSSSASTSNIEPHINLSVHKDFDTNANYYLVLRQDSAAHGNGTATQYYALLLNRTGRNVVLPILPDYPYVYQAVNGTSYEDGTYDSTKGITAYLVRMTNGQALSGSNIYDTLINHASDLTVVSNGEAFDGFTFNASTSNHVTTVSIEKAYTASVNFYEADAADPTESPVLGNATYTLLAKVDDAVYHAQITGNMNPVVFLDSGNQTVSNLDLTDGAAFKIVTGSCLDWESATAIDGGIGEYTNVTVSATATDNVYAITARKPVVYTANITVDDNSKLKSGKYYYVVARKGNESIGFAPFAGTTDPLVFTTDGTNTVALDESVTFWIVKSQSALTALTDFADSTGKITLTASGSMDWYDYELPDAAVGSTYTITATKQPARTVSVQFKDSGNVDTNPTLESGYYYLVAKVDGARAFFAPVTGNSAELTFKDAAGAQTTQLPDVTFELVKASSEVTTLAGLSDGTVVSAFTDENGKTYPLGDVVTGDGSYAFTPKEVVFAHTTTVKIFDSNAVIHSEAQRPYTTGETTVPDPAFQEYYYILATFTRNVFNATTNQTETVKYWKVQPIDLKNLDAGSASVRFNSGFKSTGDPTQVTSYTAGDGELATRLFHSTTDISEGNFTWDTVGNTLGNTVGANLTDEPESAYEFGGGTYDGLNHTDEIHLKVKTNNYKYKVRLRFDSGSEQGIQQSGEGEAQSDKHYHIFVMVSHNTSEPTFAYAEINIPDPTSLSVDEDGYYYYDYEFDHWVSYDATQNKGQFTSHEPGIKAWLIQSNNGASFTPEKFIANTDFATLKDAYQVIYEEGQDLKGYTVHYDTADSRGRNKYYTEKIGDITWCYDQIDLISKNVVGEYDYTTILGPNLTYGIVAEHLYQPNHLQTNFAVNHFSGHGHDVRPDLSGANSGNIVIGEFNVSDGSKRNSVGEVADDPTWGRLKVGKPLNGTLIVYADNDSGYFEGDTQANVYDNPNQTIVVPMDGATLSQTIVEPGIEYMQRMSAILAAKPCTERPVLTGNTLTIDTTGYDEYATIYLDGDLLKNVIENPGGLTINKLDHQTIVFNFTDKVNTKSLNITQFNVYQPSFANYGYSESNPYKTESPEATGSDQNKVMDDIARHIVWNLASCTNKVTIDTAGGIFLQPNDDSEIEIKGTTAGWIVSDGYVYNGTAEWHNVYEEMPDSVEVNLFALKYLDGKMPTLDKTYGFKLERLIFDYDNTDGSVANMDWEVLEAAANNSYSLVQFEPVRQDKLRYGWNIFRITENGSVSGTITDTTVYYAAVYMDEIVVAEQRVNNIFYTVTQPRYYTSFDESQFVPYDGSNRKPHKALTGVGGERVAIPTFENETISTGLTLMKRVDGTEAANKTFTFKIEFWTESGTSPDITKSPLTQEQKGNLTVSGLTVQPTFTDMPATGTADHTETQVVLRNGRKVTIGGLTQGVKYKITEVKIGTTDISVGGTQTADGYTPVTVTKDDDGNVIAYAISGEIANADQSYAETFINQYESSGEIDLNVSKALEDEDGHEMTLVDNMFAFTLSGGGRIVTGYNDAAGHVFFPALTDAVGDNPQTTNRLSFTQADMAGATRDEDGYLVKEVTYVIREGKGTLTQAQIDAYNTAHDANFSYESVVYDGDKLITLVLTDDGSGTIAVKPKVGHDTTLSVDFENHLARKANATLQGTKTMEGRPMNKAEFMFNAKLYSVDGTVVTEAEINSTITTGEVGSQTTTDKYTEAQRDALYAKRAQASPVDVIGVNEKVTTNDGTENHYTGSITFPKIYYTVPGTYIYEITEDVGSMPIDARQKAGTATTWYAKVIVDSEMNATVTYSDAIGGTYTTYSDATDHFVNETRTIGFNVTKEWLNASGAAVSGSKFITFSVTKDGVQLTAADLSGKLNITAGSVEMDGNNVKLTSDAGGVWPTATFTGMTAGRYIIQEVSHSAVTGGSLRTTYAVLLGVETETNKPRSSNILREDGETLTITNKESTDRYTNITVNKVWKDQNGTEYHPTSGSAKFELWQSKTIGQASTSSGTSNVTIDINDKTKEGSVGSLGNVDNGKYIELVVDGGVGQRSTFLANFRTTSGPYIYIQYFTGTNYDGTGFNSTDYIFPEPLTPAQQSALADNGTTTLTFKVPVESVDITVGEAQTSPSKSMKVLSQNINSPAVASHEVKSTSTTTQSKVTTFTVSYPDWSWSSGSLPVSKNDGEMTWKYYIKEIEIPDGVTVTYSPSSGTAGQSGMVNDEGSATITVTNTTEELPKGALKITKLVTVNNHPTDTTETDGDYTFKVTRADTSAVVGFVRINVVNGIANSYKVIEAIQEPNAEAWDGAPRKLGSGAIVGDLEPGNYVVKEIPPTNGVTLASAVRGDDNKEAVDANNAITVVVHANDTTAVQTDAQAKFTNNKPTIIIVGTKTWITGAVHADPPTLKLSRTASGITEYAVMDGEEVEWVASPDSGARYAQPTWSKNGTEYAYSDLLENYDYAVEEIGFSVTVDDVTYTYTVTKNDDNSYTVAATSVSEVGDLANAPKFAYSKSGNVLTNTEMTQIVVQKVWLLNGNPVSDTPKSFDGTPITSIHFKLHKKVNGADTDLGTYEVKASPVAPDTVAWTKTLVLPKYEISENQVYPIGYYINEVQDNVLAHYSTTIARTDNSAISVNGTNPIDGGGITITNSLYTVSLPSTGGPGTSMFYILGSILSLVAAVLLITKKRSDGAGIE